MEQPQNNQSDQITLGLWLFGIYGGAFGAFIWEPSDSLRTSVIFCVALAFIPLLIWQVYQSQTAISENLNRLQMTGIGIAAVIIFVVLLDAVVGLGTGLKLALVLLGYMAFAGVAAWETVLHSLSKTLPAWLVGGLIAGLVTGWVADLSQNEMVKQSALIIVFSFVLGMMAMMGQLESGINSILSNEPPGEGESAIH